jgi:hypothetical protein
MSFVSFRKAFFPTEEEIKAQEKMMEEIHNKCIEDRKNVKLVQDKKDPFLYYREPFGSFLGDCCYCSHYVDGGGKTEGGWCKLCGVDCGWGFTCKDNDSEWAIRIEF